jgi:hypothetical protein
MKICPTNKDGVLLKIKKIKKIGGSNEFEDFRCHRGFTVSHSITVCNIYFISQLAYKMLKCYKNNLKVSFYQSQVLPKSGSLQNGVLPISVLPKSVPPLPISASVLCFLSSARTARVEKDWTRNSWQLHKTANFRPLYFLMTEVLCKGS